MTVTDSRNSSTDTSGDYLNAALNDAGHTVVDRSITPNNLWAIRKTVCNWLVRDDIDIIITNGGTGFTHNKATIPALKPLFDNTITGFGELFRHLSFLDIGSAALQSDAIAGTANNKLIFCIPGSTGACRLAFENIFKPQFDSEQKPCNFAGFFK